MDITFVAGIFGLLLTAIGVLVLGRLVYVSAQIIDIWKEINSTKERCNDHAGQLGYLKGKLNKE